MALPFSIRKSGPYTLSAAQTGPMSFDWRLFAAADMTVWRWRGDGPAEALELNTDYSISGLNNPIGGSVSLTAGALEGDRIVLEGARDVARTATITAERGVTPTLLNNDLDLTFAQVQEIQRDVDRAFKTSYFEPDVFDLEGRRLTGLPEPVDASDAATKAWTQAITQGAVDAAAASAAAAAASAGSASSAAGAASGSAEAAEAARLAAEAAAQLALGGILPFTSRAAIKALDTANYKYAYLRSSGRDGIWLWLLGDYSAHVGYDTAEGLYMAADGVPATTGAWVRSYTGPALSSWFGASGDGVADDTAALQAAINACPVIDLGDHTKTYKITAPLNLSAGNKRLFGNGAKIDMQSIPSGNLWGLRAQGSAGSGTAITSGATVGSFTINLASTAGFAVGDFVQLSSSDNYPYGGGSYNVNKGEIRKIRSIVANTSITFTTPLLDTYTSSPVVRPITWVENIHVSGITLQGSNTAARNERGIVLQYVKGFSVKDCNLDGQDQYQIEASSCIYGTIEQNFLRSAYYNGVTGTIFYGIAIVDCSQWINVAHNVGDRARHLVVTAARSSGQGFYGQPYYINVHHNHFYDSMSGGAGRSYAYEQHGFGRFVSFNHNTADGCHSGLRLEMPQDCAAIGNIFRNYGYSGIIVGGSGTAIKNVLIANNLISKYTGEVTGVQGAFRVEAVGATIENLKFVGNVMTDTFNASVASGAGISIGGNTYGNVSIENNQIDAGTDANTSGVLAAGGAHGIEFLNNQIYRYRQGIAVSANSCVVRGNTIKNSAVQASGFGLYSNGDRNIFQGNTCVKIAGAFRADTASTNNLFANNQAVQCTSGAFSNSGTGNTGRDNDVIT